MCPKICSTLKIFVNYFKQNLLSLYGLYLLFNGGFLFISYTIIKYLFPILYKNYQIDNLFGAVTSFLFLYFASVIIFALILFYRVKNLSLSEWFQTVLTAGENIPQVINGFIISMILIGLIVNTLYSILESFNKNNDIFFNLFILTLLLILLAIVPLLVILLSTPSVKEKTVFEPKKVLIGALSLPKIMPPSNTKKENKNESFAEYLCKQIQYKKTEQDLTKSKEEQLETIKKLKKAISNVLQQIKYNKESDNKKTDSSNDVNNEKRETIKEFKNFLDENLFSQLEKENDIESHTWYPLIKSVLFHVLLNEIRKNNLDVFRIYLLTSAEVKDLVEELEKLLNEITNKLDLKFIKNIEVITPDKLDKCFLNGLDFNNIKHLELYAKKLSDDLLEKGYKDEDISVNITSGTVPVSLILTFLAISEARQIEYIHQKTKDLIVLPISPMTIFNLHASPKVIA